VSPVFLAPFDVATVGKQSGRRQEACVNFRAFAQWRRLASGRRASGGVNRPGVRPAGIGSVRNRRAKSRT